MGGLYTRKKSVEMVDCCDPIVHSTVRFHAPMDEPKKILKKILIIEDEKPLARALELKLGKEGFTVKVVNDGQEASNVLTTEKYDVIVLDLVIPKIDGFSILTKVRDEHITTPVIVASNLGQPEDMNRAKTLGAKQYFVKSSTPLTEIVAEVRKLSQT